MIRKVLLLMFVLAISLSSLVSAHPGRLDANGGHNCSAQSKAKELCTGYHYHNGSSSSGGSSGGSSSYDDNESDDYTAPAPIEKSTYIENEKAPATYCTHVTDEFQRSTEYTDYYKRIWDCSLYSDNGIKYAHSKINITLNGNPIFFEQLPVTINGSTLVPFRKIAEALGATVTWNGELQTITVVRSDKKIILTLNDNKVTINNSEIIADVAPLTINGLTFVPLRLLSESLGAEVSYISDTNTAIISAPVFAKVIKVIEGDLVRIQLGEKEEILRFSGIDAPNFEQQGTEKQPFADEAFEYTKQKLEGKEVALEYGENERDAKANTLVAFVWLGNEMFNKTMLSEGYAKTSINSGTTSAPLSFKYGGEFSSLETQAKEAKKGLWQDIIQFQYEGDKSNRAVVMSGLNEKLITQKEQSTLSSSEVIVILDIATDKDLLRYKALSDTAKKSMIFDHMKHNIRGDISFAKTRFVRITYKDVIYMEATIKEKDTANSFEVKFYPTGK
ncbi:stalk domain-containing protein [Paenibacillus sp. NPDC056579]|uniref:stalk domain-containing protein n=1 Tax=Paenibacillus sp. NPDC056579 TaxID=3345871 RepID=UPI0036C7C6C5